jgi:hypothetical protein
MRIKSPGRRLEQARPIFDLICVEVCPGYVLHEFVHGHISPSEYIAANAKGDAYLPVIESPIVANLLPVGLDEEGWVDVDGSVSFIPEMKKYCEKTVTIKEVNTEESYYFIEGDDYCAYSEGMFE